MSTTPSIPDPIREKFPNLRPTKVPAMMTLNGIGVTVYGKRDWDEETGTYVKTHAICFLYVPLFFLGAYRVADAGPRSWYFIGKESLSNFARSWNTAVAGLLVLAGLTIGWNIHTSSPEYQAEQQLLRAEELEKSGKLVQAAGVYRSQINGPRSEQARSGLARTVEAALQSDAPDTVAGAIRSGAGLAVPILPDLPARGLERVAHFRSAQPEGALDILNAVAGIDRENPAIRPLQIDLLKTVIAAEPGRTNRVVELALLYESAERLDDACELLKPYVHRLGSTEGARILGQRLLQEGNYSDAYGLLFPYVSTRLDRMRSAETVYTNILGRISDEAVEDLRKGRADRSFYTAYENASEIQQQEMVNTYVQERTENDPRFQKALETLKEANRIVPVTLDLGIVQLNRAQTLSDAVARKAELEAAEKTFLAIRGFAGESDEYRMFLGQVYYWLGRSAEGKELFDQLLASNKRAFSILISVASTLRSVGEAAEARALAEEAFKNATTDKERFAAAGMRALMFKDQDDQIAWLEKRDPNDTWTQIELNYARGCKALNQGNKTLAASLLQKSISGYEKLPKNPATLNNCGLACFQLYEATGNPEDNRRGMALIEEAIELDPGNSILLFNSVHCLMQRAIMDVAQDAIRSEALLQQNGLGVLSTLYRNQQERDKIMGRLQENEAMKRALVYLEKALLLAPKDARLYETSRTLHSMFRDLAALQKLEQRFQIAAPNLQEDREEYLKAYSGAEDEKQLANLQSAIQVLQASLASPSLSNHPLSSQVLNVSLLALQQNCILYGGTVDSEALLKLANDLYQQQPTAAAAHALKSTCLFRAVEELSRQNADFDRLARQSRRALSPEHLICHVLGRGGPLAELTRKNPHVLKAVALEKQDVTAFPNWATITQWALLRQIEPEAAAELAKRIRENALIRLSDELQFKFAPLQGSGVIEQYWTWQILGNEKKANEIYATAVKDGVPLPPL